ncbi:hypothetical protein MKW94_015102 [Papaver nudicaule]|uniref:3-hydroxyisobutyryl-CoA hydrolase n=1 Tax=Papaver nudicaule TaxID=74823 RepID=A0AA41V3L0_PAPNU|nr:hypothetical protein [Papaver nudicaule]
METHIAAVDHVINQFIYSFFVYIQVEHNLHVRTLILNRANRLNVLSSHMVCRLLEVYTACQEEPRVKLVILRANGKSFCVGGDLEEYFSNKGQWRLNVKILWNLYTLMYKIATLGKPQVSILNGTVMGAGCGISLHGTFRVVTEKTVFAMPEAVMAGIVPDVGASFFLSRLPGFYGEYIGLTGARLDGTEMLACGLATHFVPSKKLSLLEEELNKVNTSDLATISAVIDEFSEKPPLKERSAYRRLDIIDRCFSRKTVEDVISALETESVKGGDAWISQAVHSMKKASPVSLKVFLNSIREGRLQGLGQCLAQEYRIRSHELLLGQDIFEAFRANFVRKDRTPKWKPSRLDLVTNEMVDSYFSKVDDDKWEDLVLPVGSSSSKSTSIRAKL